MTSKLFCFDFDDTIVNGHMHNHFKAIWNVKKLEFKADFPDKECPQPGDPFWQWNVNDFLDKQGIKNKDTLLETFRAILCNEDKIAITTFSQFPDQITEVLKILGLTDDELAEIPIIGGFPVAEEYKGEKKFQSETGNCIPTLLVGGELRHDSKVINYGNSLSSDAKQQHIIEAMRQTGFTGKHEDVILLDDSTTNCTVAKEKGFTAILVPKEPNPKPEYLEEAERLSVKAGPLKTNTDDSADSKKRKTGVDKVTSDDLSSLLRKKPRS